MHDDSGEIANKNGPGPGGYDVAAAYQASHHVKHIQGTTIGTGGLRMPDDREAR